MQLSQQMSFGLHEILKTTAANIHSREEWTVIFALLEYVGAGRVPTGNAFNQPPIVNAQQVLLSSTVDGGSDPNLVNSMENQGGGQGLQHSLSQDPLTNTGNQILGYSSGSDRGYTSDSELEVKSQNSSSQTRLSSVSPAQSWILLTHNTIDDTGNGSTTTTVSSPSRKPIGQQAPQQQQPQQISFTPDPKALLKSCETLSFLVRDAAHITPDNFTLCVGAIRSFVEACSARLANKNSGKDSSGRKLKRGKRYHSPEHGGGGSSSGIPKSKTFPSSTNNASAYDADYESDPEADQIAASHQCSIQVGIKNVMI